MSSARIGARVRRLRLALGLALAVVGGLFAGAFGTVASAQTAETPRFEACAQAVDDDRLRSVLVEAAKRAMRRSAESVDYQGVVEASWLAVRFDAQFANIVDAKIDILRQDRAYLERLLDGNVPSRARDMAERTADLVFNSPEFAALQAALQGDIGRRLEPRIAGVETETQGLAAECVRAYLGGRFADSVRRAFTDQAGQPIGAGEVGLDGVSTQVAVSLAGVVAAILTVVFRRLVRRIVRSVVQRLAGAIAARLAAWASVVAGAALLVYELVAGADGVFPIIRSELTSLETRNEMRGALVSDLSSVAPERLEARAPEIAERVFQRWRRFKADHERVLRLASEDPALDQFVATQPAERFVALSSAVAQLLKEGGPERVRAAVASGDLAEAMAIPSLARQLDAWVPRGKGFEDILAWRRVAGDRFDAVLDAGVPARLDPKDTSGPELDAIAALDDPAAATAVASLPKAARVEALGLPPEQLRALSRRLDPGVMAETLEAFLGVEDRGRRQLYLRRIAEDPAMAAAISAPGAAGAVASSRSPQAALDILLDPAPIWSPFAFVDHVDSVVRGAASPQALAQRYGWSLALSLGLPLLIAIGVLRTALAILGWMLRPFRRARPAGGGTRE